MRNNQKIFLLLLFLSVSFINGCATAPKKGKAPLIYLDDLCKRYDVECEKDKISSVVTLTKDGIKAKALIGSGSVIIGTEEFYLSSPIKEKKRRIVVPSDFKRKIIDHLRQVGPIFLKDSYTIVIDPGHGGKDSGAVGQAGTQEKKIVLDIAQRLKEELEKRGVNAVMTRNSDQAVSLQRRTEVAVSNKADLFISVHANSSPSSRASGVEVWSTRSLEFIDKNEDQRNKNHRILYDHLSMSRNNPTTAKIVSDLLYRYQQIESERLASHVVSGLSKDMLARDRGSKKSGFFVLRNALMPAILIEVGFLSNSKEENLLNRNSYRQKIAEKISKSILEYVGLY